MPQETKQASGRVGSVVTHSPGSVFACWVTVDKSLHPVKRWVTIPCASPPLLLLFAAEIRSQMRSLLFLGMHTFLLITRCLSDSSFFSKLSIHCLVSTLP